MVTSSENQEYTLPIYFGVARSKGFSTLRNVSKLTILGQDWARKVCRFSVVFGYLAKWKPNLFAMSRDHFDFYNLFFNLFEEERIIILAFPGFEPTHLCDPLDQRRTWGISRLRYCDPRQFGKWKIAMKLCTSFGTRFRDFSACFGYFTKWNRTTSCMMSWDHFEFSL